MLFLNGRPGVAELADAPDSKSGGRKAVWVRPPPSTPTLSRITEYLGNMRFMRLFDDSTVRQCAALRSKKRILRAYCIHRNSGAGHRNRTYTTLRSPDFESGASASSASPAQSQDTTGFETWPYLRVPRSSAEWAPGRNSSGDVILALSRTSWPTISIASICNRFPEVLSIG
jgi:hypothetical protein